MLTNLDVALATLVLAISTMGAADSRDAAERFLEAVGKHDAATVRRMLQDDPALANAKRPDGRTAVLLAAFKIKGEAFTPPARSETLQAVLAAKPRLDFFEACLVGDEKEVARRLEADAALAKGWHPMGWSALHFGAFSGSAAVVRLLLDRGAPLEARARTPFRNTPLQVALLPGQLESAKALLDRGADPLARQAKGFAPIHEAALLGRQDLVDLLLAHGAEVGARGDDGRTAVSEAVRGGHPALADYLRAKGGRDAAVTANVQAAPE
jgi:ankyrin repeat protein